MSSLKHSDTTNTKQATTRVSLYRKYRPQAFEDVIGQDHIVEVLRESVKKGSISHAYLFCGTRGTGKTSVARIFARALGTTQNDIYEIDAASNTSVDDIRELSEAVYTVPLESTYKVYILDEVHMLSKSAFNAFLKTLEEPPRHVIFILATTETEKLPETIVSRCEVYNFKKPTTDILKKVVQKVAIKEGVDIEPSAAELVALLGDGSFRDTLSTLQKVISYKGEDTRITLEEVEKITGAPRGDLVTSFTKALLEKNKEEAIRSLHTAYAQNVDIKVFTELALTRLRYVLLRTISEKDAEVLASDISAGDRETCTRLAKGLSSKHVAETLSRVLGVYHSIGKSYVSTVPLEVVVGMME